MKAYHIYYKFDDKISTYEYVDILGQLCSILFWKGIYGDINLYCNKSFYERVRYWGLDKYYDTINIDLLENLSNDKLNTFWSYPKIHAINHISKYEKSFCVMDTDFWFYSELEFNKNHSLVGYHFESLQYDEKSPYISPDNFITIDEYDWKTNPINCAFLYFNSKDLITKWNQECLHVINNCKDFNSVNSSHTVFIEQRLLTTICNKLGLKFSSLIENTYIPFAEKDGSEWSPRVGFFKENLEKFDNIKHIWGLKKMFDDPSIRKMVLDVCKESLDIFFPDWSMYNVKLYEQIKKDIINYE